jgi:glucosylceramidase
MLRKLAKSSMAKALVTFVVSVLTAMLQGCGSSGAGSDSLSAAPRSRFDVMQTTQTAYLDGKEPHLLKNLGDVTLQKRDAPSSGALVIDRDQKFQTMLGFGGAFTEASADNWKKLTKKDQEQILHLYFADPKDGGHGYTMGRVPMSSCDFSLKSYNFDNVTDDFDLVHFDTDLAHDESSGMLPMMRGARDIVASRSGQTLNIFASPWSPPAWMKIPWSNSSATMSGSASPQGLNSSYQGVYAKYFSKFITAYKAHGIHLWGVTPQNEPEFAAAWDACVYSPEFEAEFVRDHLGPTLKADHPNLKIIGYDHNKDHVVTWAQVLYNESLGAKKYLDGIGVHWYGGLNTEHLNTTHFIAPDKFILATEACNCPGVIFNGTEWWTRAEKIAIDILEDIKWWAAGWVDWNLVLSTTGGPNKQGNECDANIIADPNKTVTGESVILQASYYYMGHFSRFIPAGSRRVGLTSTVSRPPITATDVFNQKLRFNPCATSGWGENGMTWSHNKTSMALSQYGLCAELDGDNVGILMRKCIGSTQQKWAIMVNGSSYRIQNVNNQTRCLTFETVSGPTLGLDAGVNANAGLAETCGQVSTDQYQTFQLSDSSSGSYPEAFHIQTSSLECMLPVNADTLNFDAVAFETPSGDLNLIAMNKGEQDVSFQIYDSVGQSGTAHNVTVPKHGIVTYTLSTASLIV